MSVDRIDQAFRAVNRADFLTEMNKDDADIDVPLPIGYGQTNSQPTTVRMMLEWLNPQPNEKILDVGSGSCWTTALLAFLTSPNGKIYAVEKIPELVAFGDDNLERTDVHNAQNFQAGTTIGLPKYAPYDRILVSAGARKVPQDLLKQLKIGGRLVIPIRDSIFVIDKEGEESYEETEHPGFVFVPLIGA